MTALVERYRSAGRRARIVVIALTAILVMTIAEMITGTSDLTSSSTASAALRLAIPILLAGLGGLYSERSGVVNIGLEGMMIAGTWFAAWGAWMFGPWEGAVLGIVGAEDLGEHPLGVLQEVPGDPIVLGLVVGDGAGPVVGQGVDEGAGIGHEDRRMRRDDELRAALDEVVPAGDRADSDSSSR